MTRSPLVRRRALPLVVLSAALLAACGDSGSASPTSPSIDGTARAAVATDALVGASTVDGLAFDASTLAGKPTVVWFWAPWCLVCRGEAPDIVSTVTAFDDRVNFVGVAGLGESPEMREFVSETGTGGFVHLDDTNGEIWTAYGIYAQPAFAFITADGRLVQTYDGPLTAEDLTKVIDNLLKV